MPEYRLCVRWIHSVGCDWFKIWDDKPTDPPSETPAPKEKPERPSKDKRTPKSELKLKNKKKE